MSVCLRAGNLYKRHSYLTKKDRRYVRKSLTACVHCGHPKPVRKTDSRAEAEKLTESLSLPVSMPDLTRLPEKI